MCTVTFITAKDRYYITSNRDEKADRKQALQPASYCDDDITLVYPKDVDAGGTWIALHNNGNAAVLLNGAFTAHVSEPPYNKSRGIIFLDVISSDMPVEKFQRIDLTNIEPFTLVVFDDNNLYECRWDGSRKYHKQLNKNKHHIWSSATLYNEEIVKKREQWFAKWLKENPTPSMQDILHFHQFAGEGDTQNDLLMNRNNNMLTVSVTGIEFNDERATMHYIDLKDNVLYQQQIAFMGSLKVV
ncbi:MAG TPA: NRDE family protein [Panacibacter sp.]|nr:NRDE family protein [Panacibacter sp.]